MRRPPRPHASSSPRPGVPRLAGEPEGRQWTSGGHARTSRSSAGGANWQPQAHGAHRSSPILFRSAWGVSALGPNRSIPLKSLRLWVTRASHPAATATKKNHVISRLPQERSPEDIGGTFLLLMVSHGRAHRVGRVDDMAAPRPPPAQRKAVRAAVGDRRGHLRMPSRSGGPSPRKTTRVRQRSRRG